MRNFLITGFLIVNMLIAQSAFADQANVFIYHRFNDLRYPSTNVSSVDFRAHLDLLTKEGFTVLTLGQVVDTIKQKEHLPARCAVITVDDAYRSFLTAGWPLLKQYGYPATLFVSTDTVGGREFLTWRELRELKDAGVEIGNHSASHMHLIDKLSSETDADWAKRIAEDLRRSQLVFEEQLGSKPKLFAYPYGEFSPELTSLVKLEGFTAAFGQQSGVIANGADLFSLPRFPIGGDYTSLDEFREKLFMKSLSVRIVSPQSTVLQGDNPPKLRFFLNQENIQARSLRCFVPGQPNCTVKQVSGGKGLYEAVATHQLSGRRSKYTLTATDMDGNSWYWFSQLWVRPGEREMAYEPVSR